MMHPRFFEASFLVFLWFWQHQREPPPVGQFGPKTKLHRFWPMQATLLFIFLIIDLVEGILAAIFFDEHHFRAPYLLAVVWAGYACVGGLRRYMAQHASRGNKFDDFLIVCFMEAGQCGIYINFCKQDAATRMALFLLASIQVFLKLTDCICSGKKAEAAEVNFDDIIAADAGFKLAAVLQEQEQRAAAVYQLCPCFHKDLARVFAQLVMDVAHGVLPLLFQEESPFREPWYRIFACVMIWWNPFVIAMQLKLGSRFLMNLSRFYLALQNLFLCIMYWYWGLSPLLFAAFDRVYTMIVMVSICLLVGCSCCAVFCSYCCGSKQGRTRVASAPRARRR